MRNHPCHSFLWPSRLVIGILVWYFVSVFVFVSTVQGTDSETWNVDGETYSKVRVREVTPATVTIFHSGGIAQLDIADLPVGLRHRFSYDPEAAEEWKEDIHQERRAQVANRIETRKKEKPEAKFSWLLRHNTKLYSPDQVEIRSEVDLRPSYRKFGLYTKQQGRRPSCSVFAIVSALEYNLARRKGRIERLSEEYLIWATLTMHPGINIDSGFNFTEVLKALNRFGVPPIELMPNTLGKKVQAIKPSEEAYEAAKKLRKVTPVMFSRRDSQLLRRIIGALNEDNPVIIGVRWPHWKTLQKNNLLRKQKPVNGYSHAVTLVGYRSPDGTPEGTTFIFRNSYGQSWGVGGCGFIAASYLQENLLSALYLDIP